MLMILVKNILDSARKRLAVLSREASLFDAAQILANRDTPLVVVCDSDGIAVGVISRKHVIKILPAPGGGAVGFNAGALMHKAEAYTRNAAGASMRREHDILQTPH